MDLNFTDDQRAIRDLAEALFGDFCADDQIRAFAASEAPYDAKLWAALGDTGLLNMTTPEADGGGGLGMVDLMLVLESQGRHIAPAPLWRHSLATSAVARFGAADAKARATGGGLATLALDEAAIAARRDGDGWVLDGHASTVSLARASDWLLVTAGTDGAARLFVVALDAAGLSFTDGVLTHGEPISDIAFDGVRLPGWSALDSAATDWATSRAVACLAALQLGVAEEALKRTAAYVSERRQFGRPIGTFQAVAVRAGGAYVDVEALRSVLWRLCWTLDAGVTTPGDVEVAKIWAAQCGHRVAHTAQHLHGGMGADLSYPLHRFYLWARALEMTLGGAGAHLAALGDWLATEAEPSAVFIDD